MPIKIQLEFMRYEYEHQKGNNGQKCLYKSIKYNKATISRVDTDQYTWSTLRRITIVAVMCVPQLQ